MHAKNTSIRLQFVSIQFLCLPLTCLYLQAFRLLKWRNEQLRGKVNTKVLTPAKRTKVCTAYHFSLVKNKWSREQFCAQSQIGDYMYPESVVQYRNLGKAYFYIFPFKRKYVEEGKNSYAFFFPLQKLTSIFFTETHMSSPLARGSRPSSKNAFFSPRGKIARKNFYHENTVR